MLKKCNYDHIKSITDEHKLGRLGKLGRNKHSVYLYVDINAKSVEWFSVKLYLNFMPEFSTNRLCGNDS